MSPRVGVKTRLLFSFSIMVILVVSVGSVGWWGISNIQQALNSLQQESLPEIAQSMALAEHSASLVAQAPFVANAKILFHLDEESARLKDKLEGFSLLVRELRSTALDERRDSSAAVDEAPSVLSFNELARHIEANLLELIDVTRSSIFLTARMRDRQYELNRVYQALEQNISRQLASSRGRLVEQKGAGLHSQQPMEYPETGGWPDQASRQRYILSSILGEVHRIAGALNAAMTAEDSEGLRALEARYQQGRQSLQTALEQLTEFRPARALANAVADLSELGTGTTGVFTLRRAQLEHEDRRAYLLTVSNILSADLNDQVAEFVGGVKKAMDKRSGEAASVLDNSRTRIILLGAVCLAAAFFSAFYVVRDLGGNLSAVTRSMIQLASGDREIQVPAMARPDEIGSLARAFNVFKENMFKLDEASRRLVETNKLLETIFHNINDGLSVFDSTGRLVAWNPKFLTLYGFSDDDIAGSTSIDVFNKRLTQENVTVRGLDGQLVSPEQIDWERQWASRQFEECLPDGRILELRSSPMPDGGFVTLYTDLTDRKAIEAQLRQAQKMESVGQLTGGLAHDFNNLLAAIIGNLSLLQEKLAGQDHLREQALRALEAADRGAMLTQRLLAFSRKQALQPQSVDVNELIEGMVDLLEYSVGESIVIELQLQQNVWPVVIDPGQLENSLMNLVLNSRDAMPEGGRLTIQTENRVLDKTSASNIDEAAAGAYVTLSVSDNGSGIPEAILQRVFEPFFTTKAAGTGSGLGLSMVYGFIKQSGGHIAIESTLGQGTTITCYMPKAEAVIVEPKAPQHPASAEEFNYPDKVVMVVEDDADVRAMTVAMLSNLGCQTIAASNGQQALELLAKSAKISLLFTDVILPGDLSGPDIARIARTQYPDLKVLYCSAYTHDALIEDGYLKGNIKLLEKPFKKAMLVQKLHEVFEQ